MTTFDRQTSLIINYWYIAHFVHKFCISVKNTMVHYILLIFCVVSTSVTHVAAVACVPSVTTSSRIPGTICANTLIFEDNFTTLNLSKWSHEVTMNGGGNGEFQVYWSDKRNSLITGTNLLTLRTGYLADIYGETFLKNGTLNLGPNCTASWNNGCVRTGTATNYLPPITSARLNSIKSFSFKYGRVEVRARNPIGDWLWPAIWMLPTQNVYGQWPRSGEIDIMESRGNRNYTSDGGQIGIRQVSSTLHWGTTPNNNQFMQTSWYNNSNLPYSSAYQLYQLRWTPDNITFTINGQMVGSVSPPAGGFWQLGGFSGTNIWQSGSKMAPFDQEFFLILNLAVGATNGYFPDDAVNSPGGKPWLDSSLQPFKDFWQGQTQWKPTWQPGTRDFLIDYVRVWSL